MCPSVLGRVETRTAILIGPALLGLILYFVTDNLGYLVLLGIYYLIGVALDIVVYPQIIKWQPPWLTFVLGAGEFVIVYSLGKILEVPLESFDAIWFYWVSWTMAVWTRIVILPIVSLTWIESGGEFRRTGWSHPAEQEPLPVVAALTDRPVGRGRPAARVLLGAPDPAGAAGTCPRRRVCIRCRGRRRRTSTAALRGMGSGAGGGGVVTWWE